MKKLIALVLAMAFVVAACSSTSTEEAVTAYCDDLGNLKSSLVSMTDLDIGSTLDDVNNAKEEVKKAYDKTVESAQGVDDAVLKEMENATSEWQKAVDAIASDATIEDALVTVQAADGAYIVAIDAALSKVTCK